MRYLRQHITTIFETYNGSVPLAHFLKNYFKQHPILGSRDRKMLSAMAYSWYRCSKGMLNDSLTMLLEEPSQWAAFTTAGLSAKDVDINMLFPYAILLSSGINKEEWLSSMLVQPDLFIRIRKDKGKIISLLNEKEIPFTFITDNCLALPNGAKIDALLPEDCYAVQDASSQHTGSYFAPERNELWYDCCSGAGGKSLLLKDMEPGVRLTISDTRESIIHNLQQRFRQYRLELPTAHVTDVSNKVLLNKAIGTKQFDNIICDVPCSGSGTWARTPEQLYFFDPASLEKFPPLQEAIAVNVAGHLKPGGRLIYITCSVFKKENEDVVGAVIKATGLTLIRSQIINGISVHADSMFIAELVSQH
jgi:16S rRNA (cytosine967-C5)-methyltransferase